MSKESTESLQRGIIESSLGETISKGSFAQYAEDEEN